MRKFIVSVLGLGFLGVASTATYYSFNSSENKDFEEWIKNLENSWEKVKNLAQTIKDKVKNLSGKQFLKDFLHYFSSLESFEKYDKHDSIIKLTGLQEEEIKSPEELGTQLKNKIQDLKEKIRQKNPANENLEEIYTEIKKAGFLISEIWNRSNKLRKEMNEWIV